MELYNQPKIANLFLGKPLASDGLFAKIKKGIVNPRNIILNPVHFQLILMKKA